MKITQENVFRILGSVSNRGMTVRELLSALNQKRKRKTLLRKTLKKLAQQNQCFKQNNRYYLKEGVLEKEATGKKPYKQSKTKGKAGNKNKHESGGIILKENGKQFVYSFSNQKRYKLSQRNAWDLLPGDTVKFFLHRQKNGKDDAEITEIVVRRIKCLKGKLFSGKKSQLLFSPNNDLFGTDFTVTQSYSKKDLPKENVWLEIPQYPKNKSMPEGRIVSKFSDDAINESTLKAITAENNILTEFSPKLLERCSQFSKAVRLEKSESRTDLRALPFVTIDGDDARDFDDSIYARKEKNGYRIWVSIADVAEYVSNGSDLDKEAFDRGVSTYFPGTVYPMLPEILSNGLCSLKEGVNRKTLTCELLLKQDGKVLKCKVYSSINKIACRLTYDSVDRFFESGKIKQKTSFPDLGDSLKLYKKIAEILESKRRKRGTLNFVLPDTRFHFDKNGRTIEIKKEYQSKAMKLIEQFMLEANENVGKFCIKNRIPIIWRNHPPPLPEKTKPLNRLLWNNNIKVSSLNSGQNYNSALKQIEKSPGRDFLEHAMLRSMSLACYETECKGHFGLSAVYYCHFTSPIRRYSDLQVHRALKKFFKTGKSGKIPKDIGTIISKKERQSVSAERSAVKLRKMQFLSDRIGDVFSVRVSGFLHNGLFVEIEHPFAEGYLPLSSVYDDRYDLDELGYIMRGKRKKRNIIIGTKLKVILTGLNRKNLGLDFSWICWENVE